MNVSIVKYEDEIKNGHLVNLKNLHLLNLCVYVTVVKQGV